MIRTQIIPVDQNISITLPSNYVGKKVEVIVYPIDEFVDQPDIVDSPLTYFASEKSLAKDWLTAEEDIAWKNL